MDFKNKYLKYSPEITLEIFTLVWDKLSKIYQPHLNGVKLEYNNSFKENNGFLRLIDNNSSFGVYYSKEHLIETTVQEILGYDPFVKDFVKDFVLPEKWYCSYSNKEEFDIMNKFFRGNWNFVSIDGFNGCTNLLNCNHWFSRGKISDDIIKITFDQFKKYVLKETIETQEKVILEYVECIKDIYGLEIGKIYHVDNNIIKDGRFNNYSIINNNKIKPSTKKAFDAQNQPKSIEKWSVGSYVVFLARNLQNNNRAIGDISQITKYEYDRIEFKDFMTNAVVGECSVADNLRWFATEAEAEEFAKTLKTKKLLTLNNWYQFGNHIVYLYERNKVYGFHHNDWFTSEGFNEYNLKYVDSCTVEEKFTEYIKNNYLIGQSFVDLVNKLDFQIKNYNLNFNNNTTQIYISVEPNEVKGNKTARIFDKGIWAEYSSTKSNKQAVHCKTQEEWDFVTDKLGYKWITSSFDENSSWISLDSNQHSSENYWKKHGYQILSFQEWCDLNGYKMEKEVKFEVGKWYKNLSINSQNNTFGKFLDLRNNDKDFWVSEYIYKGKFTNAQGWLDYSSETVEINIEEIQQYLPDGHPDKIKVDREFKVGDWVIITSWYFDKSIELNQIAQIKDINLSSSAPYKLELSIPRKNHSVNTWYFKLGEFRHATPEEIQNYKDREAFNSYNLADIKLGKTLSSKINPCQAIGRLDRSNKMILSIDDEELPMVSIIKTNSIKQLLNNN